jgi:hypothetical protein
MERRKYLISDLELTDVSLSNKRYFETTQFLISNFEQRVELDIQTLPECTRLDSLERYLEIYETAYLNFTINSESSLGDRYRESLQDLVSVYGESVIYPTKRKVEYIKGLISKGITLPHLQNTKQKPELTINQIALKFVYTGSQITRKNGDEIAKKYGHTSGEKLFQQYSFYLSAANRKGKPTLCTPTKLKNKIKLLHSILKLVTTDQQKQIRDEVGILKNIQEEDYN